MIWYLLGMHMLHDTEPGYVKHKDTKMHSRLPLTRRKHWQLTPVSLDTFRALNTNRHIYVRSSMTKDGVRMLYNLADLSCSFGSSIMQIDGRPALDEYLEPNKDYKKNIVWLKMVELCQMFVADGGAFIYILRCLLCCYLTNILRHDYVVCSKKSAMHVWKIKLQWTDGNTIYC